MHTYSDNNKKKIIKKIIYHHVYFIVNFEIETSAKVSPCHMALLGIY